MPNRTISRYPLGYVPGKTWVDTGEPFGIKVGLVTRVDEEHMIVDLKILSGGGFRPEVDMTQAMAGPRSFWGGVPEVNSLVLVGYRRIQKNSYDAVILGYLPSGNRSGLRFDPFSVADPNEIDPDDAEDFADMTGPIRRIKRLRMSPGDVGGMSAAGSELVLSEDVAVCNRAGDSIELRDDERALISHTIHRITVDGGVKRISGPARRSAFFLPEDLFETDSLGLKTEDYYGLDELQSAGPGVVDAPTKWVDADGNIQDIFNDFIKFPAVTLASGKRYHYTPTSPGVSVEDADSSASAFVEDRLEMQHTSDLVQDVLEEIDGFNATRRVTYIERVLGTVIGNDLNSSRGMRQYGLILKPRLFPDFQNTSLGQFSLEEVSRQPTAPDTEANTNAGAFLFRIRPPTVLGAQGFVAAVSKQGKLFLNVPASASEDYSSGTKRISAELNLEGALKAFIGASTPDRISAHITLEGGLHLDIGRDNRGNAVTVKYHSGVKTVYDGNPNENDVTVDEQVSGVKQTSIKGAEVKSIEGSKKTIVSGGCQTQCDRFSINAFSGYSGNFGELNLLVSGKSQYNYALAVTENVIAGGRVSTILAGGCIQNVAAGAVVSTAGAGAMSINCPAGAYTVTVGTGAISATTTAGAVTLSTASGAMAITAAAGAVTVTAGLALNLTAGVVAMVTAPMILLGGPTAVLGVCRALPMLPPGTPTLDPYSGMPLFGSATVLSS